nr:hypothetical protein [Capnocytophaga canimorsus]
MDKFSKEDKTRLVPTTFFTPCSFLSFCSHIILHPTDYSALYGQDTSCPY